MWSPSQAIAGRAAKRNPALYTGINLAALVSVLVALLALFLGGTAPDVHQWRAADLPEAQHATLQHAALREDAIRITVVRDGRVYFRNHVANPQELPGLIRTAFREGSEKTIYLVADRRAKYGDVKVAVDQVRLAGISNVVILTQSPTPH